MDETGTLTLAQAYQPLPFAQGRLYGEPMTSSGHGTSPYGFAGEYTDSQTGLQYLRARYYAPGVGRFLTKDAWAGDALRPMSYNGWGYGFANPVRYTDPSGHIPCEMLPPEDQAACQQGGGASGDMSPYNEKTPPSGVSFSPQVALRSVKMYKGYTLQKLGDDNWQGQIADYTHPIHSGTNQAQFLINTNSSWTGLCGPISVAYILQHSHPSTSANLIVSKAHMKWGNQTSPPNYMGLDGLARLVNEDAEFNLYWHVQANRFITGWVPGITNTNWSGSEQRDEVARTVKQWLQSGNQIIVGVNIDGNGGKVLPYGAAHWLVITGISEPWDYGEYGRYGENLRSNPNWVRVFNPFDNDTEYYRWGDFKQSWENNGNTLLLFERSGLPPLPSPPSTSKPCQ